MRYVSPRRNADGTVRWYWRRGDRLHRLPDDPVARATRAAELNVEADLAEEKGTAPRDGTMAWLVARYRENTVRVGKGKPYAMLAANTQANYKPWLADLETRLGHLGVPAFTRRVVVDYVNGAEPGSRAVAASVLRNLLALAEYLGLVDDNKASKLGAEKIINRKAPIWDAQGLKALFSSCCRHKEGAAVWDGCMLMLYTAQRPGDAIRLSLRDVTDGWWAFAQQKTGRVMGFPVHKALAPIIAEAWAAGRLHLVASSSGRPVAYGTFEAWFREVRGLAPDIGHLQMRDFRRSAATRLRELGLDDDRIITLTGHTRASFQAAMSDVYVVKTQTLARQAMDVWERNEGETVQRVAKFTGGSLG